MMPEWADATVVLLASIACFLAYRSGAAAAKSEERRDAVTRASRLLTSGGLAASSAAIGTVAADGTAPTATWFLFGAAGMALTSGWSARLGIRVAGGVREPSARRSLGQWFAKAILTMVLTAASAFFATNAIDSGDGEPPAPASPSKPATSPD